MSKSNILISALLAAVLMGLGPMMAGTAQAVIFDVSTPADFQSALTAAQDNSTADVINVAAGTYNLSSLLTYTASGTTGSGRLTIQGAGAATTILDGQSSTQILKLDAIKSLFGSGGNNLIIKDLTFRNGVGTSEAGGLQARAIGSNITVENAIFEGNSSSSSGIAAAAQINATSAANRCSAATFNNNVVSSNTGGIGGINIRACWVDLEDNIFEDNQGTGGQGGVQINANNNQVSTNNVTVLNNQFNRNVGTSQGGLYVSSRNRATVQGNQFVGNSAAGPGGGLYLAVRSSASAAEASVVLDNLFQGNSTTGGDPGGGLYMTRVTGFGAPTYTVANNVFLNNSSDTTEGSALYFQNAAIWASFLDFTNNTATMNSGTAVNILLKNGSDSADIYNNIIWGNDSDLDIADTSSTQNARSRVFNNDITTFTEPTGTNKTKGDNVNVDPLLVNAVGGDVHLQAASSVINAGTNSAPGLPATDYEGEARIQGLIVDMGADESDQVPVFSDIDVIGSGSFGNVTVNTTDTRTVTVDNTGEADLNIGTIALTNNTAFALSADNCSSMAITPTESPCTVQIEFTPDSAGAFADTLTIPSDDPNENPVEVSLSGTGVTPQPEISVTDSVSPTGDRQIPFGSITENDTSAATVTVGNTGAADLRVNTVTVLGSGPFTVENNNCEATTVQTGSDTCTFDVVFAPTGAGAFAGTVRIDSSDTGDNPVDIALSGTGTSSPVPNIVVTDTSGSSTDRVVTFPTLTAGAGSWQEMVNIVNNGVADLVVNGIDLQYNATFTIYDTDCSPLPLTLTTSASCFIDILFAPADSGSHADTLTITSNDPDDGSVVVGLSGDALEPAVNNPPNAFSLIFPANGQLDVSVPTEFRWQPATDPDGDSVTYDLFICTDSQFTSCTSPENSTPITASLTVKDAMYAGTGLSLMVFGIVLAGDGRRRWFATGLLFIILLSATLFTSCYPFDGNNGNSVNNDVMFTVDTLNADTQYFWKVVASDGNDSRESAVWSFTTEP